MQILLVALVAISAGCNLAALGRVVVSVRRLRRLLDVGDLGLISGGDAFGHHTSVGTVEFLEFLVKDFLGQAAVAVLLAIGILTGAAADVVAALR